MIKCSKHKGNKQNMIKSKTSIGNPTLYIPTALRWRFASSFNFTIRSLLWWFNLPNLVVLITQQIVNKWQQILHINIPHTIPIPWDKFPVPRDEFPVPRDKIRVTREEFSVLHVTVNFPVNGTVGGSKSVWLVARLDQG